MKSIEQVLSHWGQTQQNRPRCPTELAGLYCQDNQLATLTAENCPALLYLECYNNRLTSLDVRGCPDLEMLKAYNNRLTNLEVAGSYFLSFLSCYANEIVAIDLTGCERAIEVFRNSTKTDEAEYTQFIRDVSDPNNRLIRIDPDTALTADGETLYGMATPPQPAPVSVADCKITGVKAQTYTGSAIEPKPVVKYNGAKLIKGTDYTVAYKNNKAVGLATVTVEGKGGYTGSKEITFKINPKKVAIAKLVAGKKKLTVAWGKVKDVSGYQIQYGLKQNFKSAKTKTAKKTATRLTLSNLKAKEKYYVRIRTYKTVKGKPYYSAWSKAKSATTKK